MRRILIVGNSGGGKSTLARPYLPREAAGGGPVAERSEERLVEGASPEQS